MTRRNRLRRRETGEGIGTWEGRESRSRSKLRRRCQWNWVSSIITITSSPGEKINILTDLKLTK
jgi:hypothetical protein